MKALNSVLAAGKGSSLSCVVLRLGGFRMLMSFVDTIRTIIAGSGVEDSEREECGDPVGK